MKETKTTPNSSIACPFCGSDLPAGVAFAPTAPAASGPRRGRKRPGRAINLLGSQEGRTVFTGNTQVTIDGGLICYFDHLDFRGDGSSIGLSASARVHLTNCTISGWKTGVLAYGRTWINCMNCRFEDNKVGLHLQRQQMMLFPTPFTRTTSLPTTAPQSCWRASPPMFH